jgi:hypothetical protein
LTLNVFKTIIVNLGVNYRQCGDAFCLDLEVHAESRVDIDARLCIVPATTAAVRESASFCTTIIGVLGIEDIVDLTQ